MDTTTEDVKDNLEPIGARLLPGVDLTLWVQLALTLVVLLGAAALILSF